MGKIFEHRSLVKASMDGVIAFHENPKAFSMLTPFPIYVQILRDERVSFHEGEIEFRLWFGPVPVRWLARHEPGPIATSFVDRMIEGPMATWNHQHIFQETAVGVELIDRIELSHRKGWRGLFTRLVFDGLPLRFLFIYRHWRTKRALSAR